MSARSEAAKRGRLRLTGAVLVGGRSRRMGRDKARLRVAGEPLWRRQLRALAGAGAKELLVVLRKGQRSLAQTSTAPGPSVRFVRDTHGEAGPLAGLAVALAAGTGSHVLVLAVDMPAVDAPWLRMLWRTCEPGVGVVVRHRGGYEPLAAIYPVEAREAVSRALQGGDYSLQALVRALVRGRRIRSLRLAEAELWRVANWNSPADCGSARGLTLMEE